MNPDACRSPAATSTTWTGSTAAGVEGAAPGCVFSPRQGLRLEGFIARLLGLSPIGQLGRSKPSVWVYLDRCATIHTITMTQHLDLVWVDAESRVLRIDRAVPPLRVRHCRGAQGVWERCCERPEGSSVGNRGTGTAVGSGGGMSSRQSGWGTLETLLMLPILFLLFALIMQLCFLGLARLHLGHAMREGLRHASTPAAQGGDSAWGAPGDNPGSRFSLGLSKGLAAWVKFHGDQGSFADEAATASAGTSGGGAAPAWSGRMTAPVRLAWSLTPGSLHPPQDAPLIDPLDGPASVRRPDHLSASVSYAVPLKVPLVGAAFARAIGSDLGCEALLFSQRERFRFAAQAGVEPMASSPVLQGARNLCAEGGRWHWVLRTEGRIPVAASLFLEASGETGDGAAQSRAAMAGSGFDGAAQSRAAMAGSGSSAQEAFGEDRRSGLQAQGPAASLDGSGRRSLEVLHRHSVGGVSDSIRALLAETAQNKSPVANCPLQSG